jgi:hypothetical protein
MVEGAEVDFSRALTFPFACSKNKYFLTPRQFAFVSGLFIILDSPLNQFRYAQSAPTRPSDCHLIESAAILVGDLTASELHLVLQ